MKRLLVLLIIFWISCVALAAGPNAFQYYYQGEYNKAQPMLLSLAENNDPQALYFLANMNLFGYGMMKNPAKGFEYMKQAADVKNLNAQMYLGAYYLNHEKNLKEALVWLKKAADLGNSKAQMYTSLCYFYGLGAKKNLDTAKRYIIKAAQNGIPMAQFLLANMFLQSRHAIDRKMGGIWMAKAAKNNYADAENNLHKEPLELQEGKPWESMIALLEKAGVVIVNPKRMLAQGNAQTQMPIMQSLPKSAIIKLNYRVASPNDVPIRYILLRVSKLDYLKQSQKLPIHTYTYVIPQQVTNYQEAFQALSRQAMHGQTQALFELALLYERGVGVEQDRQKAFSLFKKVAELHYLKAEYVVGVSYLQGSVVNKDTHMAMQWLRKAALHGNVDAQLLLGNIYEYGLHGDNPAQSVKKDLARAKAMYSLAAQSGMPTAQYRLANMYTSGLFNPTNNHRIEAKQLKIAYRLYSDAAKAGSEKAQVYLGYLYAAKNESETKHEYAYRIAKKFAEMRNHDAELLLAILYDRGIGVKKNHYEAIAIYRSLAQENNAFANFILGTYYYLYNKHDKRAEDYLAKAAKQGIVYAQYNLAILAKNNHQLDSEFLLLLNEAVAKGFNKAHLLLADYYLDKQSDSAGMEKAAHIYQKLAKKQDPRAELRLGYMYQHGVYFSENNTKALYWYQQSANNGNKIAQYQLGEMYFLGQGVKRNVKLALKYYKKSAAQQFAPAMAAIGYIKAVDQFDYQNAELWYQEAAKRNDEQAEKNLKMLVTLRSHNF